MIDSQEAEKKCEDRIKYITEHFKHRHTGEEDERRMAEYLSSELADAGLTTTIHEFDALGWEVRGIPTLRVLTPKELRIEAAPMVYSKSTGGGGISGHLIDGGISKVLGHLEWSKFPMVSDDNRSIGYVLGRPSGPAVTQPVSESDLPSCVIGADDAGKLRQKLSETGKMPVRYECETHFSPHKLAEGVQGMLRGRTKPDEIIIVNAHEDSMGAIGLPEAFDSPGAADDAAGCATLIELARYFAESGTERTIYFSATYGEEWGKLGSKDYFRVLQTNRLLDKVVAFVNLDSLCFKGADRIFLNCSDYRCERNPKIDMMTIVRRAFEKSDANSPVEVWCPPRGFDQQPFFEAGKPVCTIFTNNDDFYHRSTDRFPDSVDPERLTKAIGYYADIIEQLQVVSV